MRNLTVAQWEALSERERKLQYIGDVLEYWLKWVKRERDEENLPTDTDTHLIFGYENAPPAWPTVGQLTNWLKVIREPVVGDQENIDG